MEEEQLEFGAEHEESSESIEKALKEIRTDGDRIKLRRRATATGSLAVILLVAALVTTQIGQSSSHSSNIAQPPTSVTTSSIPVSLAARVIQTANTALANVKTLSATEHEVSHQLDFPDYHTFAQNITTQYRIRSDGAFWESEIGAPSSSVLSYSPTTGKYTDCESGSNCYLNWGPALWTSELTTFNDALDNAQDGVNVSASEAVDNDTKMWTLEYDTHALGSTQVEHVLLKVDESTGLPMELHTTVAGKPDLDVTLTGVQINPTFTPSQLQVAIPKGVTLQDGTVNTPEMRAEQGNKVFGTTVAADLKSQIPTTDISGFASREFWSITGASGLGSVDYLTPAGTGDLDYVQQALRSGVRSVFINTYNLKAHQRSPSVREAMTDFDHSRKVASLTAKQGAMKGATFDVYLQPNHSLFVAGRSGQLFVTAQGNLTMTDATNLVNGFTFGS